MVIHNENDLPVEMAVIKKPLFEQQSFIFHKNHVEESLVNCEMDNISEKSDPSFIETTDTKVKRKKKISNKHDSANKTSDNSEESSNTNEISPEDLEELKTVYKKCKAVIKKIEIKYGHLLNFDDQEPSQKRPKTSTDDNENICHCSLNKKIVFDDEGKETTVETLPLAHICPQKLQIPQQRSDSGLNQTETKPITVEYHKEDKELPESLTEISKILKNPNIEVKYRNQLVQKATQLKQQFVNEIRFNKHSLIEKLKANPDELLTFKGTNLSTLSGYL